MSEHTRDQSYVILDGCHNCSNAFRLTEFECTTRFFCTLDAPKRPLCGSLLLKEAFMDQVNLKQWLFEHNYDEKDYEKFRDEFCEYRRSIITPLSEAWREWAKGREVMLCGKCEFWVKD